MKKKPIKKKKRKMKVRAVVAGEIITQPEEKDVPVFIKEWPKAPVHTGPIYVAPEKPVVPVVSLPVPIPPRLKKDTFIRKFRRWILIWGGKPMPLRFWTTLFFGPRGSGKTLHQSKTVIAILDYYLKVQEYFPAMMRGLLMTNQNLSPWVLEKYKGFILHFDDLDELHYCPRTNCWKGNKKHLLHNVVIVFDDVSVILDPKYWDLTPPYIKKYFFMGRHFGIHILASLVSPDAVDINFRRSVDVALSFNKIFGTPDPDETIPQPKSVFGMYRSRFVDAKTLWLEGDKPEMNIKLDLLRQEEINMSLKEEGKEDYITYTGNWVGRLHLFNRTGYLWPFGWWIFGRISRTDVYNTLENVKEREVKGLVCEEIKCIDKNHTHPWDFPDVDIKLLKKEGNFCDKVKRIYTAV